MPYQVPDYLGLAPVVDPTLASRKKRKKLFIAATAIIVIVVLAVGGVLVSAYLQQNDPQQRLYRALENAMSTSFVKRSYTITDTNPVKSSSVQAQTDFSDPANPKSTISASYKVTSSGEEQKTDVDEIIDGAANYYSRVKASSKKLPANTSLNKWYQYPIRSVNNTSVSYDTNQDESRVDINSSQGLMVMGNYTAAQRSQLMSTIQKNNIYTVKETVDKDQLVQYTIILDKEGLNELNKQVVTILSLNQVKLTQSQTDNGKLSFVIDKQSDRIVKIIYSLKRQDNSIYSKTIGFEYPSTVSVKEPQL